MRIRKTELRDLDRVMEIYVQARKYMAENGNPYQWGPTNWPPETLILDDIDKRRGHVCVNENDEIIGTFFFASGLDIEPAYRLIEDGAWLDPGPYGVVHRIASDRSQKGIGTYCLDWAFEQCGHLRVDTHGDNLIMQNLLKKLSFIHCGTIHVEEDDFPRMAFEKSDTAMKFLKERTKSKV
ncbi:MAG: GNAT family N-acetyltransferase [Mailhella sp.]|nr:GNAT family N-acetyltransferase [Mailhella sp.]